MNGRTHLLLNILAYPLLHLLRPRQALNRLLDLPNDPKLWCRQVPRAYDTGSRHGGRLGSDEWRGRRVADGLVVCWSKGDRVWRGPESGGRGGRTSTVHVALHLENEVPHFGAAFGVLEAEGVVHAVGLGPYD